MNRAERRRNKVHQQVLKKTVMELTPRQTMLLDELVDRKSNEVLNVFKKLVDEAVFTALRNNHVSTDRANKIMSEANQIINKKVLEG